MPKTKIIATIGPASLSKHIMKHLVEEGINCIRINTSYGNEKQYDEILTSLKHADPNHTVKTLLDVKDLKVIEYFNSRKMDIIALSFTETVTQIKEVKELSKNAFLISKIESKNGVKNFDSILQASDGIMIARGDLSVAEKIEKVPPLQKVFTHQAVKHNKFVVAATEMLLSMVGRSHPTNAEASDVANAVFDGVSAVMLSEETAIGKFPVESVTYMRKIIHEAELSKLRHKIF